MASIPQYSPFFKYRGQHDIYHLGYALHSWHSGDPRVGSGSTSYSGYFIYNPQSTNGATGKIIRGDFAIYGAEGTRVRNYAQQASMSIQVKLRCHDIRRGSNPNNPDEWVDMTHCLQITPNNTTMKITTYWGNEPYSSGGRGYPIYGMGVFRSDGSHVSGINIPTNLGAVGLNNYLHDEGYVGFPGYEGHSFYMPEVVGYRYHSNNGRWSSSSAHITPTVSGWKNMSYPSYAASNSTKSTVDGGGGEELEYKFIFDSSNGTGLDYYQLEFIVSGELHYTFPSLLGFYDYNKIDNPMLSVPDFCNADGAHLVNWPKRFDAWSYYYDGSSWIKFIPLFKFYDGSSWTCF